MEKFQTLLFYKYVKLADAEEFAKRQLRFCKSIGIKGRVLVGDEGLNGSVSGTPEQCQQYMDWIHSHDDFNDVWFKKEDVDRVSFAKMHVRYRPEIVTLSNGTEALDPNVMTGVYLEPEEFMEMKDQDDVVILDTRNIIEYEVGHFKNSIHLDIDHFRDLPTKLEKLKEMAEGKKVLAYCTGGIRCEKATAYLKLNGFDAYQLHGGILNYYQKTGGKDFDGKMYVFDNRVTTVVNDVNPTVISKCYICGDACDRIINCANPECNLHEPICEKCGWEYEGACSTECKENPRKREYDGTGYYLKAGVQQAPTKPSKIRRKDKVEEVEELGGCS